VEIELYFAFTLLTCALAGFLAFYTWLHRSAPDSHVRMVTALSERLLAIFRFQFLKRAPAAEVGLEVPDAGGTRSLAVFVLIFVLMAASLTSIAYVSYRNYEGQFRRQVESQLSSIAELKRGELQSWRQERLADAEILYRNPAFSALVQRYLESPADAQAQAELQAWLGNYKAYKQYDRIILLDARGVERLAVPDTSEPVDAHLAQEAASSLRAEESVFLDFYQNTAGSPIHLALLVPVLAGQADTHPVGLLVLRIDPNVHLYPYLQQWPVPSASAETLLARREGDDVLYLNDLRFRPGTALNYRASLENIERTAVQAALGQTGVVEGVDYRGEPVVADVSAVPDSPWFLVVHVDTAEVYAPLRERLWQMMAFFGMLLAACGVGLLLIWRWQRLRYYREQVEAAHALRESEERFRSLYENSTIGLYRTTPDGKILLANPTLVKMLGYSSFEELAARDLEQNGFEPPYSRAQFIEVIEREGEIKGLESGWAQHDGSVIFVRESARVVRNSQGKALYYDGTIEDITDRKRAEEEISRLNAELEQRVIERTAQLKAANKELEAFSYSVSHDLRAPLRGIDGWSLALLEDYGDQLDEQAHHYLGYVRSEAQRLGCLIDDTLQLARVTRAEMQRKPIDLSVLAQAVAARLQAAQPERRVELLIQPGLTAHGDARLLEVMLANLLDNAWKFTPPRPLARIEFGRLPCPAEMPRERIGDEGLVAEDAVVYFVRDNGVGFDMAFAQKLFGAFQRMHKTSEFPGTGIGLAIVQRIVHRHGGRVWAEASVDRGATFYFTLEEVV
jgi:PAS domain S-box-containing protein